MNSKIVKFLILLIAAAAAGCSAVNHTGDDNMNTKFKFVAHRGESMFAPENTAEAYTLAWRNGTAWGAETDVYLTQDGVLVCSHDDSAIRTAGVDFKFRDHTLEEAKKLDVGKWKGPQWTGCKVPSLREVFNTMPPEAHIYVEIKSAGEGFAKAFEEARIASGVRKSQIHFISFSVEELKSAKEQLPGYPTYLLRWSSQNEDGSLKLSTEEIINVLSENGFDGIDLGAPDYSITPEYIKAIHDAGFSFHAWTINNPDYAAKLIEYGVDSITSDSPYKLHTEIFGEL